MSDARYVRRGHGTLVRWVAVIELDADECEAIGRAFGPNDGAYEEMLKIAEDLRAMNEPTEEQG